MSTKGERRQVIMAQTFTEMITISLASGLVIGAFAFIGEKLANLAIKIFWGDK